MEISQVLQQLKSIHKIDVQRVPQQLSFGNKEKCSHLFREAFKSVDRSIDKYEHLKEYNQVIDWMADNKAKGLFLQGDVGRGKSVIIAGIIPVLMYAVFGKVITPYPSEVIPDKYNQLVKSWAVCIDDLGTEPKVNNFGEKYEGFPHIANAAEARLKLMFISTNLSSEELLDRYGERTMDRIRRLCKVVKFNGKSLRK